MKPVGRIKPTFVYYIGVVALAAILGVLVAHTGTSQQILDPPGVVLDYRCPTYALPSNTPIAIRAAVVGAKKLLDEKQVKNIRFSWDLSVGKLLTGQGTGNATIDPSGFSRIDVKLRVDGAPPYMEREKTCELVIAPNCNAPALFDEYGGVSNEEERQHLDRFAAHFRDIAPQATAYIISYAGRSACYDEGKWRADRIKSYLVETRGLSRNRIIVADGGIRENWSVDVFVQSQGKCGPMPSPTLTRDDVSVGGQCSAK